MEPRPDYKVNPNGKHTAPVYHPYRCLHCGRLLFEAVLLPGCRVRIRCTKCNHMLVVVPNTVTIEPELTG